MSASVRTVAVELGDRTYEVQVGSGLLSEVGRAVAGLGEVSRPILVTNATVRALYGQAVVDALAAAGTAAPLVIEIGDGEQHKNLATLETIYDAALDAGIDRGAVVVALGGGVVGDVAAFAAATLLRGLRLVMVPTTLLAQVDSSVGGKTAVNRPQGKNLVGAFFQPNAVVADTSTLATLSPREYRAGLAEVVKYGVILDAELFALIEERADAVVDRDASLLTDLVARSAALKGRVVEQDEREGGLRAILNFGHTVGHAIEQATGYSRYLHGEAVAIGMVAAAKVSAGLGACDAAVPARIAALLERLGLDVAIASDIDRGALESAIAVDKKSKRDRVTFIVCDDVGRCSTRSLAPAEIRAAL